jgi:hypothetical protein
MREEHLGSETQSRKAGEDWKKFMESERNRDFGSSIE